MNGKELLLRVMWFFECRSHVIRRYPVKFGVDWCQSWCQTCENGVLRFSCMIIKQMLTRRFLRI